MTRKRGYRYKFSMSDMDNKDSHTLSIMSPIVLNTDKIETFLNSVSEVKINDIFSSDKGYVYAPSSNNLCTVSLKGLYKVGEEVFTTERLYFKYVRLEKAKSSIFEVYLKEIFGNSFEVTAFRYKIN